MLANRINSITIRNFRSLGDVTVELEDLTVLVGANGTGKSNFLNALRFTRDVITEGLYSALSHQGNFVQRQHLSESERVSDVEIEIRLTLVGQEAFFSFAYGIIGANQDFALKHEVAQIGNDKYETNANLSAYLDEYPSSGGDPSDSEPNFLRLRIASFYPKFKPFVPLYEFL